MELGWRWGGFVTVSGGKFLYVQYCLMGSTYIKDDPPLMRCTVVYPDPELFGLVGSGIIVPDLDPDLTFLTRKSVQFVFDYTRTKYFLRKSLNA
jgi:hypothetical protein